MSQPHPLDQTWEDVQAHVRNLESLASAAGILEWDQHVYMPAEAGPARGASMATLMGLYHQQVVDPAFGEKLAALGEAVSGGQATTLQAASHGVLHRLHSRATRVPESLVRRTAEAKSAALPAWMQAREAEDYGVLAPALEELIDLVRETAACHGPVAHPYDALLQEYDADATTAAHEPVFARLAEELGPFVAEAQAATAHLPRVEVEVDEDGLFALSEALLSDLGFDLGRGRLDRSQHPFTMGASPLDVRLTTHTYGSDILGTLKGTIHECGHGLYEQGLPLALGGTGLRDAASVSLHESQSRFWENHIAGSRAFFTWLVPRIEAFLPGTGLDADTLFRATSRVAPGHIRVKADEASYNLHIIVRFELEKALVSGQLAVADLEEAWNAEIARVGLLAPTKPTEGVLQDVHWPSGLFGYFPTYTLGNLAAARLEQALASDIPDLWGHVERGEFGVVLDWLREKVHHRAKLVSGDQIVLDACGEGDSVEALMSHLRGKLAAL